MLGAVIRLVTKEPPLTGGLTAATAALGLIGWRLFGQARDAIDPLINGLWVMSGTGFVCYALHRYRTDLARMMLKALLTIPPQPTPHLHAVPGLPEGTGSQTVSARESAG